MTFTKQVGHPDCVSEPVKQCENIPNSNKRNVARTVCDTVVDTHEVEVSFKIKPEIGKHDEFADLDTHVEHKPDAGDDDHANLDGDAGLH